MSSLAHHAMRTAGFISLQSERTLRDYSNYFKCITGFQLEIKEQLYKEARVSELQESQKFCAIVVNEMKTSYMTRFLEKLLVSLNKVKSIMSFLNWRGDMDHPRLAKHLLVLMVRSIFFKFDVAYAHFGTESATAIIWEAVWNVENPLA